MMLKNNEPFVSINFGLISEIDLSHSETWQNKRFLTFDIDWAHDQVIEDAISLVEAAGIRATWFVTHQTKIIERLMGNPNFELGIHPNFNNLLNGEASVGRSASEIIDSLLDVVPNAHSVRSHSLTQSERLLDLFAEKGLSHVSNTFIPASYQGLISPWRLWSDITIVPHFWQDNVAMRMRISDDLSQLGSPQSLRVFDFHPIHIYLDTEDLSRYDQARDSFQNPSELLKFRNENGDGTRTLLKRLLGGF
jgi:hypothetical protein